MLCKFVISVRQILLRTGRWFLSFLKGSLQPLLKCGFPEALPKKPTDEEADRSYLGKDQNKIEICHYDRVP